MRNQMMYLNEENYKKMNSKIKMAGRIVIAIAIMLIVAGFIIKVGSMGIEVPKMGSENWFEMETARSQMEFGGIGLIMFGVWLGFVGCIIRFFVGNQREINAYAMQTRMPIVQEGIQVMAPTIGEAGATMIKTMAPAMGEVAKEMAPIYGEVAKNVAQGIKEGLNK